MLWMLMYENSLPAQRKRVGGSDSKNACPLQFLGKFLKWWYFKNIPVPQLWFHFTMGCGLGTGIFKTPQVNLLCRPIWETLVQTKLQNWSPNGLIQNLTSEKSSQQFLLRWNKFIFPCCHVLWLITTKFHLWFLFSFMILRNAKCIIRKMLRAPIYL